MGKRIFTFLAIVSFALLGCGKFRDKFSRKSDDSTPIYLNVNGQSSITSTMSGGVMVYALRADGYKESFLLTDENDNKEFLLPNGTYQFMAVGWEESELAGNTRCGHGLKPDGTIGTFQLMGNSLTIPISISESSCNTAAFAPGNFYNSGGSNFRQIDFIFCNAVADVSSKVYGNNCNTNYEESYRFIKGRTTGGTLPEGVDRTEYSPVANRLVYIADYHEDERKELYSSSLSGGGAIQQNPSLCNNASCDVLDFEVVKDTNKVVYMAKQDSISKAELYITTLGTQGATKISGATMLGAGVVDFIVTPDGTKVVFVAEGESVSKLEVFVVDLTNTSYTRTKISGATPTGSGVSYSGTNYRFELSPDGAKVVFAGTFTSASRADVYTVNIGGTGLTLINTGSQPNMEVNDVDFNYNSNKIIWNADHITDGKYELFVSPVGTASYEKLNPTPQSSVQGNYKISRSADIIVFAVDDTTTGVFQLYSSNFSTFGSSVTVKIHENLSGSADGSDFRDIMITPDNTKVVYLTDEVTDTFNKLYSATIGSSNSSTPIYHSSLFSSIPFSTAGQEPNLRILDNNTVYYIGDVSGSGKNLYKATIEGANNNGVLASPNYPSGVEVKNIQAALGKIFYVVDDLTNNKYRPFYYDPSTTSYEAINVGSAIDITEDVHIPNSAGHEGEPAVPVPGLPNAIVFSGTVPGTDMEDLFVSSNYATVTPSSVVKVTRGYDGSSGSGKFRLGVLSYKSPNAGSVIESGPGIFSACFDGPSNDGFATAMANAFIPAGPPSTALNPFVTVLDVFPGQTNCTGSFQRITFNRGINNSGASPQAAKVNVFNTISSTRIFVKD